MKLILKSKFLILFAVALVSQGFATHPLQAQTGLDPALSVAPPPGKAWEAAWGFWPKATPDAWQQTHWGFVNQGKQRRIEVLFLGDSLTKGWAGAGKEIWEKNYQPLKAFNIGIGGDTTRQTLWRLDHEALAGSQPKVVVLMIGVNNIFTATGKDQDIAKGVEEILKKIQAQSPASKVLLLGVLPLGNESQSARAKEINGMLAGLASGNVQFLDMSPKFLNAEGKANTELYTPDLVHLAQPGYAVWDETMKPVLEEMLK